MGLDRYSLTRARSSSLSLRDLSPAWEGLSDMALACDCVGGGWEGTHCNLSPRNSRPPMTFLQGFSQGAGAETGPPGHGHLVVQHLADGGLPPAAARQDAAS